MKKRKIIFEGLALVEGHFSGIGQYTLGILRGIDELLEQEVINGRSVHSVYVAIPYDSVPKYRSFGFRNIKYIRVPFSFRIMSALWHRGLMPPLDLFCGKGYYFFTRFVGMPLLFSKSSTVIYDLSYELHKQYSADKNAEFLSKGVRKTLGKVLSVITISKSAKNELLDFYSLPSSMVKIAYPAVDPLLFYRRSDKEISKVKQKYGISGEYITTLSNLEPRKNLDSLVDAYVTLPKDYTEKVGLLMVGVTGWKTEALFKKIIAYVEKGYKIMRPTTYVSDEDKPALLSGAKLLVYPSHYEGFGMPPLEALACGTPVITSNNSSLPEVVEGVGEMVKSSDVDAIRASMRHYLDENQRITSSVKTDGPKRANKFSWTASAKVFIEEADRNL